MTLSPEVLAIAERQAAGDRALLARLVAEGKVLRKGPETALTRAMRPQPHDGINLGIRPKKGKRRK